ncbi:MAG TPA: hypothetical protein VF875_05100 [Anaeromyxobacter sp.]
MAGMEEMADVNETMRSLAGQARELWDRFAEEVELDRRMRETPMTVLAVAAGAGFVLGGGLWPVLRPFVKTAARSALSPTNLLAIGAALGALRASIAEQEERPEMAPEGGSGAH